MFPGMGGMNPKQMQKMMKQLGIKQEEIPATEVIIKTGDKEIIFQNPQVSKVNMMGKNTYQIVGNPIEKDIDQSTPINEEDIETVAEQANVSKEKAKEILKKNNGDIAATIIELTGEQ